MTIEEKARAYDEAKARMSRAYNDNRCSLYFMKEIFPEPKVPKDNNMRLTIIQFLEYASSYGCPDILSKEKAKTWIAWLEKQKERSPLSKDEEYTLARIIEYIEDNDCPSKWKDLLHDVYVLLHQKEQKPTDKVEPRFKGVNWISNGRYAKLIVGINSDWLHYMFNDGTSERIKDIDKKYHLWTIQDAQPGDVLQLGEVTAIFKEFIGNENCRCYCSVYGREFEIPSQEGDDNSYGCYNATPATKEERDLLFRKMHEAGYTFDFNKKELKKIEDESLVIDEDKAEMDYCFTKMMNGEKVSSAWSEEDDNMITDAIGAIGAADYYTYDDKQKIENWLKSLKERMKGE